MSTNNAGSMDNRIVTDYQIQQATNISDLSPFQTGNHRGEHPTAGYSDEEISFDYIQKPKMQQSPQRKLINKMKVIEKKPLQSSQQLLTQVKSPKSRMASEDNFVKIVEPKNPSNDKTPSTYMFKGMNSTSRAANNEKPSGMTSTLVNRSLTSAAFINERQKQNSNHFAINKATSQTPATAININENDRQEKNENENDYGYRHNNNNSHGVADQVVISHLTEAKQHEKGSEDYGIFPSQSPQHHDPLNRRNNLSNFDQLSRSNSSSQPVLSKYNPNNELTQQIMEQERSKKNSPMNRDLMVGSQSSLKKNKKQQKTLNIILLTDQLGKTMQRNNSEQLHPWSNQALLQKYSVRQSSKADLKERDLQGVGQKLTINAAATRPLNLIERLNLNTIKSFNDKASSQEQQQLYETKGFSQTQLSPFNNRNNNNNNNSKDNLSRKVSLKHFPEVEETLKRDSARDDGFEGIAFSTLQSQPLKQSKKVDLLSILGLTPPPDQIQKTLAAQHSQYFNTASNLVVAKEPKMQLKHRNSVPDLPSKVSDNLQRQQQIMILDGALTSEMAPTEHINSAMQSATHQKQDQRLLTFTSSQGRLNTNENEQLLRQSQQLQESSKNRQTPNILRPLSDISKALISNRMSAGEQHNLVSTERRRPQLDNSDYQQILLSSSNRQQTDHDVDHDHDGAMGEGAEPVSPTVLNLFNQSHQVQHFGQRQVSQGSLANNVYVGMIENGQVSQQYNIISQQSGIVDESGAMIFPDETHSFEMLSPGVNNGGVTVSTILQHRYGQTFSQAENTFNNHHNAYQYTGLVEPRISINGVESGQKKKQTSREVSLENSDKFLKKDRSAVKVKQQVSRKAIPVLNLQVTRGRQQRNSTTQMTHQLTQQNDNQAPSQQSVEDNHNNLSKNSSDQQQLSNDEGNNNLDLTFDLKTQQANATTTAQQEKQQPGYKNKKLVPLMMINANELVVSHQVLQSHEMMQPERLSQHKLHLMQSHRLKTKKNILTSKLQKRPNRVIQTTSRKLTFEDAEDTLKSAFMKEMSQESLHTLRDKTNPARQWKQLESNTSCAKLQTTVQMRTGSLKQLIQDQKMLKNNANGQYSHQSLIKNKSNSITLNRQRKHSEQQQISSALAPKNTSVINTERNGFVSLKDHLQSLVVNDNSVAQRTIALKNKKAMTTIMQHQKSDIQAIKLLQQQKDREESQLLSQALSQAAHSTSRLQRPLRYTNSNESLSQRSLHSLQSHSNNATAMSKPPALRKLMVNIKTSINGLDLPQSNYLNESKVIVTKAQDAASQIVPLEPAIANKYSRVESKVLEVLKEQSEAQRKQLQYKSVANHDMPVMQSSRNHALSNIHNNAEHIYQLNSLQPISTASQEFQIIQSPRTNNQMSKAASTQLTNYKSARQPLQRLAVGAGGYGRINNVPQQSSMSAILESQKGVLGGGSYTNRISHRRHTTDVTMTENVPRLPIRNKHKTVNADLQLSNHTEESSTERREIQSQWKINDQIQQQRQFQIATPLLPHIVDQQQSTQQEKKHNFTTSSKDGQLTFNHNRHRTLDHEYQTMMTTGSKKNQNTKSFDQSGDLNRKTILVKVLNPDEKDALIQLGSNNLVLGYSQNIKNSRQTEVTKQPSSRLSPEKFLLQQQAIYASNKKTIPLRHHQNSKLDNAPIIQSVHGDVALPFINTTGRKQRSKHRRQNMIIDHSHNKLLI